MKHCKIKCEKKKDYENVKDVLGMVAIEYYQEKPGKAIHLCGFDKKKDVKDLLEQYGLKNFKVKVEEPDFETIVESEEELEL